MKHTFFQILLGFSLLAAVSCNSTAVFDQFKSVPESGWHKDSLVVFEVPVTDSLQTYNWLISVRNETDYDFSNLWLFIELERPDGVISKDTFEIVLAEPSGRWLGEGFGSLRTRQVLYRSDVSFPVSGEYKISIQQGMREENLTGISDVGFTVEEPGS